MIHPFLSLSQRSWFSWNICKKNSFVKSWFVHIVVKGYTFSVIHSVDNTKKLTWEHNRDIKCTTLIYFCKRNIFARQKNILCFRNTSCQNDLPFLLSSSFSILTMGVLTLPKNNLLHPVWQLSNMQNRDKLKVLSLTQSV